MNFEQCLYILGGNTLKIPTNMSEDLYHDPEEDPEKFISILIESLFILRKIPEAAEVCCVI